jgi:hypothetical protein
MGSEHNTIGSLLQIAPVLRQVVIPTCVAVLSVTTLSLHHITGLYFIDASSSPSTRLTEFRLDTLRLRLPNPWAVRLGAQKQSHQLDQKSLRPTASQLVRPKCQCPNVRHVLYLRRVPNSVSPFRVLRKCTTPAFGTNSSRSRQLGSWHRRQTSGACQNSVLLLKANESGQGAGLRAMIMCDQKRFLCSRPCYDPFLGHSVSNRMCKGPLLFIVSSCGEDVTGGL